MRFALLVMLLSLLLPGIARAAPLTSTAHLDWLGDAVTPPDQPGHSTYGDGPLGVVWTYADRQQDGSYKRVGGGPYDPTTDTIGQGAFNADDISRAAVVYMRHWRATGSAGSRARAVGLLRALTYLQAPNGNVVLWMQPDGTLNPSAEPVELPAVGVWAAERGEQDRVARRPGGRQVAIVEDQAAAGAAPHVHRPNLALAHGGTPHRGALRLCRGASERWGVWGAISGPPMRLVWRRRPPATRPPRCGLPRRRWCC